MNPCDELFDEITDKELALSRLREQKDSVQKLQFLRSKGDKIAKMDILKEAVKEDSFDLFSEVLKGIEYEGNFNELLFFCAKYGRSDMIKEIITSFTLPSIHFGDITDVAAEHGHKNVIDVLSSYDEGSDIGWNWVAYSAAEGGHSEIVYDMIGNIDNKSLNNIAERAAKGDNKELLYNLIAGVDDVDWKCIAKNAAEAGHEDVVIDMITRGADSINQIAFYAASGGHNSLLNTLLEGVRNKDGDIVYADDYNHIAISTHTTNNIEILDRMLALGATNIDCATYHGRVNILKKTKHYSNSEIDKLIDLALKNGQRSVVDFFFEIKKDKLYEGLISRC